MPTWCRGDALVQAGNDAEALKTYLNGFGFGITKVFDFPTGAEVGGEVYKNKVAQFFSENL